LLVDALALSRSLEGLEEELDQRASNYTSRFS
jgi:hypothetical protein